ncbi:MAG: T9SS type A sorting domain-containing protein [Ignavibacteria bacterium]|nr:T9SS type A sorting domain-containing protein [Ignavibacteria bacterium]
MKKLLFTIVIYNFTLLIALCQSGWYVSNLNPGIASLNSVNAFSSSTCLAFSSYTDAWSINYFKVYKTTNSGSSWDTICIYNGRIFMTAQFIDNLTGYAGGGWNLFTMLEPDNGLSVFKTTNGGFNWNVVFSMGGMFPYMPITDLYFINSNTGWVCSLIGNIYRTTNGGQNFITSSTSPIYNKYGIHFKNIQEGITVGDSGYISYTTNSGANWTTPSRILTSNLRSVYFINQNTGWITGFSGKILKTTNGGGNWTMLNTGITNNLTSLYFCSPTGGWAAGTNIVIATTNGGTTWTSQTINPSVNLAAVSFSDSLSGWVCGVNKIFRTNTGGYLDIKKSGTTVPEEFKLYQNYPNPFNPVTNIKFDVSKTSDIKMIIYDITGRELETLVNEKLSAGSYSVDWNGSEYSSGIYFYKLIAENYTETKKMILIK